MVITKMPDNWIFRLDIPNPDDSEIVEKSWSINIADEIAYVGQNYSFPSPLNVEARGNWSKPAFYVEIAVESKIEVPCRRCLDPAMVAINGNFSYLYSLSPAEGSSERSYGHGDDSYVCIKSWGKYLDIASQVWDALILSLPNDVLCKDDCRGLCPVCGTNLNRGSCNCSRNETDPRMEVLKDIEDVKDDTVE